MPAPHNLSCSWWVTHFCSLSCIQGIIPCHCAPSQAACASNRLVVCPTVWSSCVSSRASYRIVLSIRLHQMLGAMVVARASLVVLRFLFSFLSVRSTLVARKVSTAIGVASVAIAIATSIRALLFPSPASPVSRSLFPLTLAMFITPRRQTSLSMVASIVSCWLADALRNHIFCQYFTQLHSIAWDRVLTILLRFHWCWDAYSGVNSTFRTDSRFSFCGCYRCCRLIALFLFCQDFVV